MAQTGELSGIQNGIFIAPFYRAMVASSVGGMGNLLGSVNDNPPRHLLTSKDAERRLEAHKQRISRCIRGAWEAFDRDYAHKRHILNPRSVASIMWDEIIHRTQPEFAGIDDVVLKPQNNSFLLYIGQGIVIRFKKIGKDGRCRNIPTRQQNLYDSQTSLPGMEKGTILHAGYMLDDLRQELIAVMIVCQYAKHVVWTINLPDAADGQVVQMSAPPSPSAPPRSRFESKTGKEKKAKSRKDRKGSLARF